jgi:bifunctional non-homologous end joining protein LigD
MSRRPVGGSTPKSKSPRVARRKVDAAAERVTSRPVALRKGQRGQAGLFDERPAWRPPMLATLRAVAPSGTQWAHEIKWDGYRIIAIVEQGRVSLFSRNGLNWADRMPGIAEALGALNVRSVVIDGEAVIMDENGIPDPFTIHAELAAGRAPSATFIAFDLLHLDGEDFWDRPLDDRRAALLDVIGEDSEALQFSHEVPGDGPAALEAVRQMGLEGIVSKRRDSRYRSGRALSWIKTKCTLTEHFAVIGAEPTRGPVSSLKLARLVEGKLVPCGSAGSGISEQDGRRIRAALDDGGVIVAEVEYRELTSVGELRHPVVRDWHQG